MIKIIDTEGVRREQWTDGRDLQTEKEFESVCKWDRWALVVTLIYIGKVYILSHQIELILLCDGYL